MDDVERLFSDTSTEQDSVRVKYCDRFGSEHYVGTARVFSTQGRQVIIMGNATEEEIREVIVNPPFGGYDGG